MGHFNFKFFTFAIGLALAVFIFAMPTTTAQPQGATTPGDSSRYQLSAFAYPASAESGTPMYGAYIVDTVTGKVWLTLKTKSPQEIGKIE